MPPVADSSIASAVNMVIVDAISYLSKLLEALNDSVRVLQLATFEQRQKVDEQETQRQQNLHGKFEAHATLVAGKFLSSNVKTFESVTQTMSQIFGSVGPSASPVSGIIPFFVSLSLFILFRELIVVVMISSCNSFPTSNTAPIFQND